MPLQLLINIICRHIHLLYHIKHTQLNLFDNLAIKVFSVTYPFRTAEKLIYIYIRIYTFRHVYGHSHRQSVADK